MPAQYQERYCAFVDILGFRNIVTDPKVNFETIRTLLEQLHSPRTSMIVGKEPIDFHAQSISDAIALSTALNVSGLSILIDTIQHLFLGALENGYFIRGAICRGFLYHDNQMVFGEALVRAYDLETSVANYPRIVITKQVFDDAMNSNLKHYFKDHIRQAEDGPYFVDVFRKLQEQVWAAQQGKLDSPDIQPFLFRFRHIGAMIEKCFKDSPDNPRHFQKLQWLANYWNITFAKDDDGLFIDGPGLPTMRFLQT
jgi:hypothetical protein